MSCAASVSTLGASPSSWSPAAAMMSRRVSCGKVQLPSERQYNRHERYRGLRRRTKLRSEGTSAWPSSEATTPSSVPASK